MYTRERIYTVYIYTPAHTGARTYNERARAKTREIPRRRKSASIYTGPEERRKSRFTEQNATNYNSSRDGNYFILLLSASGEFISHCCVRFGAGTQQKFRLLLYLYNTYSFVQNTRTSISKLTATRCSMPSSSNRCAADDEKKRLCNTV